MYDEDKDTLDMAEIWRQNYLDAKDDIRNLKQKIAELENEIQFLTKTSEKK